jgi:hypothetical protein
MGGLLVATAEEDRLSYRWHVFSLLSWWRFRAGIGGMTVPARSLHISIE